MSIVRAHQVKLEGYEMHRWDGNAAFPHVITIFSAPNYCDSYNNKASVLILDVSFHLLIIMINIRMEI